MKPVVATGDWLWREPTLDPVAATQHLEVNLDSPGRFNSS